MTWLHQPRPTATCQRLRPLRLFLFLLLLSILGANAAVVLAGCGHRPVASASDGSPLGDGQSDAVAKLPSLPPCAHPDGVTSKGQFTAGSFGTSVRQGTFSTSLTSIKISLPVKQGTSSVMFKLQRPQPSSMPVLPSRIDLPAPVGGPPDTAWTTEVQYAWCNPMECRFDFSAGSYEPGDKISGWVVLQGPADPQQQILYSNLTRVTVCLLAEESVGGQRNELTLNASFTRQK
jgi:hypothetical protein